MAIFAENRAFNMNTTFKPDSGAWRRSGDPNDDRWLHNDMQNMAFLYTHKLFAELVELGEMK